MGLVPKEVAKAINAEKYGIWNFSGWLLMKGNKKYPMNMTVINI
jgi:hypothetical protein